MKTKLLAFSGYDSVEGDVVMLLIALRNLSRDRFDLHVVSKPRGAVYERLTALPDLHVWPMEMGGDEAPGPKGAGRRAQAVAFLGAVRNCVRLVRRNQIDVLYTIDRGVAPQLAVCVSLLTRRPLVLCTAYPFYPRSGRGARFVLRKAARLHAHSEYLRGHLLPYVRRPDAITVVPIGLEVSNYDPATSGEEARKLYGVAADAPLVVMTGRLNEYKGQDDLIRAARIVVQERPDTRFLIAGRGPESLRLSLESLIDELDVRAHVQLVGYVPSIPELVAASDIVAMPSWEEPFGLVALEGMAMGKPVVATRAGGVPEFVEHGVTGLLVPPRDPAALAQALLEFIRDPARARENGARGRRHVEDAHRESTYIDGVQAVLLAER
jgi:glycosyltransferase involved in cell wall biosynthesis